MRLCFARAARGRDRSGVRRSAGRAPAPGWRRSRRARASPAPRPAHLHRRSVEWSRCECGVERNRCTAAPHAAARFGQRQPHGAERGFARQRRHLAARRHFGHAARDLGRQPRRCACSMPPASRIGNCSPRISSREITDAAAGASSSAASVMMSAATRSPSARARSTRGASDGDRAAAVRLVIDLRDQQLRPRQREMTRAPAAVSSVCGPRPSASRITAASARRPIQ